MARFFFWLEETAFSELEDSKAFSPPELCHTLCALHESHPPTFQLKELMTQSSLYRDPSTLR